MTTSGSTDFTSTKYEIISDALMMLNVYGAEDIVSDADYQFSSRTLNRMIKTWQSQGYHLWTKKTGYIFLQKYTKSYELWTLGAHATLNYGKTTLDADQIATDTTLTVVSTTGMVIGDYIGVEQNDNTLFWTTITNIPSGTSVQITVGLEKDADEGLKVYFYTTRLEEPFNVYSAVRESESATDVPMNLLSYQEYFDLPNKTSSGVPISYNYDRQLGKAVISVWPVPNNVSNIMKLTIAKKFEDFDANSNTPDFPQEWIEPLIYNLSVKLAPAFGKNIGETFANLKNEAAMTLENALAFDNEEAAYYVQPSRY
jgi:hypothetical protein